MEGNQQLFVITAATEEAVSDTTPGTETEWKPLDAKKEVDPQMLQFILGVIIGGIVGFLVSAVLGINDSERNETQPTLECREIGDRDAWSRKS